ncbi:hypothetical protein J6590_022833 [Homalodisca vitripennis]|nr:hypothetical protein J6590_022833 [Homalodisca vitripennis]
MYVADEFTRFLYAVVPVNLTELMTLTFCIMTLLQLRSCQQSSEAFCSSNSTINHNRKLQRNNIIWTKVYLKACFMMGSAYILVSVVALITWNYKSMRGIPVFLVNTVKDIDRVRGIEIFFIFVLKEKVFKQLINKFYLLRQHLRRAIFHNKARQADSVCTIEE